MVTSNAPIYHKNGQEMAGYDYIDSITKIYSIDAEGNCTESAKLPYKTGKVAFSYDGRYLAFHLYEKDSDLTRNYIETPNDTILANVYVYDRRTQKAQQITHNTNVNSMYPEFLPNGDLIFINHPYSGGSSSVTRVKK